MTRTGSLPPELDQNLSYLKLHFIRENYESMAKQAAEKQWNHVHYLSELILL